MEIQPTWSSTLWWNLGATSSKLKTIYDCNLGQDSRSLTNEVLSTTLFHVEQTLNARLLTAVSDDAEDLTAPTPNLFLLEQENVSGPFMPSSESYHDTRKSFETAQAYADMIWRRWTEEYLPQWSQRSKWSKDPEKGDLVWLVDDSVKRCKYKLGQNIEFFASVVQSTRVKMAHEELSRPVVKLAPVFYDGVSVTENTAGDVGPLQISNESHQWPRKNFRDWKNLEFVKTQKWSKLEKLFKLRPKNCLHPIFGWEILRNSRLVHG